MDTLRGPFDPDEPIDPAGLATDSRWDAIEATTQATATSHDLPPEAIGQDERRMQVRAYNLWAGQLGERVFPLIEDLDPASCTDFGPYSVLLDFSAGIEDPAVRFLGEKLANECGGTGAIAHLSDVPPRSLLSRITDHYMQILANQAPIGFEAEFVNQRGVEILYRGILLPYSSNEETIDFIYGVINWKEMADQLTADQLLLEIDHALELGAELELAELPYDPEVEDDLVVPVAAHVESGSDDVEDEIPVAQLPADPRLYDWLAAAGELVHAADAAEDRSRSTLYAAVSRAYDFSLAAQAAPEDYAELLAESGLTMQGRAPMIPVVKLVFGHDYDKTRLTEYAAVLSHAHRLQLAQGSLAGFLGETEGGLKAVVKAERRLRREEQGKPVEDAAAVRQALSEKLRELEAITLEALDGAGPEFALVLIRRDEVGCAELLAELPEDIGQIERTARKLVG